MLTRIYQIACAFAELPCGSGVVKLEDGSRQRSETITFDLNQGFGNFLNCTERKSPFENESAISPAISDPMLK